MNRLTLIATVSLSCLPLSALADDGGAYLGAGFSSNSMTSSCADGYFSGSCNDPATGPKDSVHLRMVGGYDFDKHFGIEAGYSDLGTYRVKDHSGVPVGEFKATAFTLALRGGNTFSSGFSIFGKLGMTSVKTEYRNLPSWTLSGGQTQRSSGVVGGVAGQYNINASVGFRVFLEAIQFTDAEFENAVGGIGLMAVFKL
jgi:hypothetical protein